jgi:hypothetical protein
MKVIVRSFGGDGTQGDTEGNLGDEGWKLNSL